MLVGYERAEVQLLNLLDAESIFPPSRGMGEAVGTAALPRAQPACPTAPRLQEIPAGAAGVKGEQDGLASPDFYGVLGTDRDQTAAST